jgi:hypothetical protein
MSRNPSILYSKVNGRNHFEEVNFLWECVHNMLTDQNKKVRYREKIIVEIFLPYFIVHHIFLLLCP